MKQKLNFKTILIACFLCLQLVSFAQVDLYCAPGIGVGFTKSPLNRLQDSYTSYLSFLDQNFANDPYTADPNWDLKSVIPAYSIELGISGNLAMLTVAYVPHFLKQERSVMRESGYGRHFKWTEQRHDILFDVGFGSEYIDVYGSVGVNMNNYKMVSSIVYPSGTKSVTNEFDFNGVFRHFDTGYSAGLGVRIKPVSFLALNIRYLFSSDILPGEKSSAIEDQSSLYDASYARTPGTNDYPQDYNKPLTYENAVLPNFRRSYLQFTLHYFYRND